MLFPLQSTTTTRNYLRRAQYQHIIRTFSSSNGDPKKRAIEVKEDAGSQLTPDMHLTRRKTVVVDAKSQDEQTNSERKMSERLHEHQHDTSQVEQQHLSQAERALDKLMKSSHEDMDPWKLKVDEETGKMFYENVKTGEKKEGHEKPSHKYMAAFNNFQLGAVTAALGVILVRLFFYN